MKVFNNILLALTLTIGGYESVEIRSATQDASVVENDIEIADLADKKHGAMLKLDTIYLDLGVISADTISTGIMKFRNIGDEPLVINNIFSDCGCTVPSYSSAKIAPGEKGEIKVKFNGKGRGAGEFRKTVRIRSNALNPREVFFVKGRIKRVYKK